MKDTITRATKPVFETADGKVHDSWHDASTRVMQTDIKDFVDRHCYSNMSKREIEKVLLEHWTVLAVALDKHNSRLNTGAPR